MTRFIAIKRLCLIVALLATVLLTSTPALARDPGIDVDLKNGVPSTTFDALNPLKNTDKATDLAGNEITVSQDLSTPRGVISRFFEFGFPIAGFILFIMLFWGGFETVFGSAGKKSLDSGKERISAALIGFFLLFTSYWIIQIFETVFGVTILG